jgi:predicted TIM-barrel fold metal-dependent hydrolase
MVIEWNAHMFSRDVARYPFHPQAAYVPDVSRLADDPLASYLVRMAHEGIDRAVLVHPEPYGDDHRLLLDCLRREPERLRGVCLFFPKDPDAPRKLAALVAQEPRIVALRFHAHRGKEQYLDSFQDAGVRALWHAAAELGLIVELHIGPNYAASAAMLIAQYPDVPVLIDHLGEPQFGTTADYAHVLELAVLNNVYMKLSGLGYVSQQAAPYLDIQPFIRLIADTFGPERLVWGGDTPHIIDAHLSEWPEADRAKVKGGNLARLLALS